MMTRTTNRAAPERRNRCGIESRGVARSSEEACVMRVERGGDITGHQEKTTERKDPTNMTRQYAITQARINEAWKRVKRNKGAAGIDGVTIEDFEKDLEGNLYKIWNRMTSGSYFPPPVRIVEIPKSSGGKRKLGIPTVADRVAQTVVKMELEPGVEEIFHPDSYGYRPGRQQRHALTTARKRCWQYDWAVEIDIKGYFDNIDHELLMGLLTDHAKQKWVLLYVERWLKAGFYGPDSTTPISSDKGSPQGSVISPLLSNIFLHHVFDIWMQEENAKLPFERFADDIVIHCPTYEQAVAVMTTTAARLDAWKLEMNKDKSRIVYCKDNKRDGDYKPITLQFLGYEFKPRLAENSNDGSLFIGYLPAIGRKGRQGIYDQIREWRLMKHTQVTLEILSQRHNSQIRGWFNYFGMFHGSALEPLRAHIDEALVRWAKRKYKRLKSHQRARHWLDRIKTKHPRLFAHWRPLNQSVIRAV